MASYGSKRINELIQRLILGTESSSIEWNETDDPTAFLCIFDGPSVEISSADRDGSYPYVLRVLNAGGNVIESFRSNNDDPWANDGTADLDELYERARRNATNVDEVLDSILSELPDLPPPPPPMPKQAQNAVPEEPPF